MKAGAHPALAQGKVRYVGDHVAVVIAETLAQAKDAAELRDASTTRCCRPPSIVATAQNAGQPQIHAEAPNNTVYQWHLGDKAKVDAAFAAAKHVTKIDLVNNRLIPNAIEPRAAIGDYDSGQESLTLYTTSQNPHVARLVLAAFIGLAPEHKLRVIAPDVGGGFGSKIFIYAEETVCLWASSKVGRPVKWVAERTEVLPGRRARPRPRHDAPSWPLDADGKILALRAKTKANLGGYLSTFASSVPTYLYAPLLSGQYDIPAIYCEVDGVYTNTAPVDAYRGAGRPEATFVVERLVEVAARQTGQDPAEFRRKNFIRRFPHATPVIMTYDAGDYEACLDKALEMADYKGLAARKARERQEGHEARPRLLGLHRGLRHRAERGGRLARRRRRPVGVGGGARQPDRLRGGADRLAQPRPGPRDHLRPARLAAARHPHRADHGRARRHRQGAVRHGHLRLALRRGRHVGDLLRHRQGDREGQEGGGLRAGGAATTTVDFKDGIFSSTATNKTLTFPEVALQAYIAHKFTGAQLEPGLKEGAFFDPTNFTFPSGVHICEVEIDPETGTTRIDRWTAVDDFGTLINPMIVEGQVHGGIAQGVGQALLEGAVYDKEGQLVTASYMDYCMPRAGDLPSFQVAMTSTPCPSNPLGIKGCGEAGAIAAPAAVINAITDALGHEDIAMPATPLAVWRAAQKSPTKMAAE